MPAIANGSTVASGVDILAHLQRDRRVVGPAKGR